MPVTPPRRRFIRHCRHRQAQLLGAALVVVLAFACIRNIPLGHDQVWYLVAIGMWIDGAELYVDIMEINPPLAFVVYSPPVLASRLFGLQAEPSFVAWILLLYAGAAVLSHWVLDQRAERATASYAVAAPFVIYLGLVVFTLRDFGQRDILAIALGMPYLCLALRRIEGGATTAGMAVTVAGFAAFGFFLKPYFLIYPVVAEVIVRWHAPRSTPLIRAEHWALLVFGTLYALALGLVFPEYFTNIVPLARLTYFAYGEPVRWLQQSPALFIAAMAFAAYLVMRRYAGHKPRLDLLAAWLGAAVASYWVQGKGFSYHALPVSLAALWLAAEVISQNWHETSKNRCARIPRAADLLVSVLAVLVIVTGSGAAALRGLYHNEFSDVLAPALASEGGSGRSLAVLSAHVFTGFPLVRRIGGEWCLRYPTLWPVPGATRLLQNGTRGDDGAKAARAQRALSSVRDEVVSDLLQCRPDLVIVDERVDKTYFSEVPFDYVEFLARAPGFAAFWKRYKPTDKVHGFVLWRRRAARRSSRYFRESTVGFQEGDGGSRPRVCSS